MSKPVRVEIGPEGNVVRVFRRDHEWLKCDHWEWMTRAEAVGAIRKQVYARTWNEARQTHECEHCGRSINWTTFEMNEKLYKGKGGEVSLDNCEALCHNCHQGRPDSVHGDRRWQSAKLKDQRWTSHDTTK